MAIYLDEVIWVFNRDLCPYHIINPEGGCLIVFLLLFCLVLFILLNLSLLCYPAEVAFKTARIPKVNSIFGQFIRQIRLKPGLESSIEGKPIVIEELSSIKLVSL